MSSRILMSFGLFVCLAPSVASATERLSLSSYSPRKGAGVVPRECPLASPIPTYRQLPTPRHAHAGGEFRLSRSGTTLMRWLRS